RGGGGGGGGRGGRGATPPPPQYVTSIQPSYVYRMVTSPRPIAIGSECFIATPAPLIARLAIEPLPLLKANRPSASRPSTFAAVKMFWVFVPEFTPRQFTNVNSATAPIARNFCDAAGAPIKG